MALVMDVAKLRASTEATGLVMEGGSGQGGSTQGGQILGNDGEMEQMG